MSKLVDANFSRLFKSKVFWFGLAAAILIAACSLGNQFGNKISFPDSQSFHSPDGLVFYGILLLTFVDAVFISIFIGTEYSDGTLRNKLAAGHSRHAIYLSNLIVVTTAVLVMHITYFLIIVCAGIPLLGNFTIPINVLLASFLASLVTAFALSALILLLSMLIPNKAAGAVASLMFLLVLALATMSTIQVLYAPEFFERDLSVWTDENGILHRQTEQYQNLKYLPEDSPKRNFLTLFVDITPVGQFYRFGEVETQKELPENFPLLILYSLSLAGITLIYGIWQFRRKNLK